jgi:hypothetical protein
MWGSDHFERIHSPYLRYDVSGDGMSKKSKSEPMKIFLLVTTLFLTSCSGYLQMVDGLNQRNVSSCFAYNGMAGSMFTGARGMVMGVTATGGADIESCSTILGQ